MVIFAAFTRTKFNRLRQPGWKKCKKIWTCFHGSWKQTCMSYMQHYLHISVMIRRYTFIEHIRWNILEACINACWIHSAESMPKMELVLSVTILTFLKACGALCIKLAYSCVGYRADVFITHLITIIKSEVSLSPILIRGCVSDVLAPSYAVGFIYIPGKLGFLYFIAVQYHDVCK